MTNDFGNDNWNNDEERMVMGFLLSVLSYMMAAAVFALMVCMCSGCSAKRAAVGASSARVDTVYKTALRSDTIRVPVAAERRLSWWERSVEEPLGDIVRVLLWVCAAAAALWGGVWTWRRVKNIRDE